MTTDEQHGAGAPSNGSGYGSIDYPSYVSRSADVNVVMSDDGVFRYVSPACERLFGWEPGELEGRPEHDFAHADDLDAIPSGRSGARESDIATMQFRFRCRDGSHRWIEATSHRVAADGSRLIVSTLRDISARAAQERLLRLQARTDPLTGVANRMVLMDRLEQALRRLDRASGILVVMYVDLDRFKVINDSLGHRVGDQVLLKLAERLAHHLRPIDTLARLGGDEFVIVAEGVADEKSALDVAGRIMESGREPFAIGRERFECTVSVGIAWTVDSQRSAAELLQEADLALYRAKDRGRNRAEVFDEVLRTEAVSRLETERLVRRAIREQGLVVQYQPIFDLRDGRVFAVEALVRVRGPDGRLIKPEGFLESAETSDLIIDMDAHVLAEAVTEVSRWPAPPAGAAPLRLAINVTARHLADVAFAATVRERLEAAGMGPSMLQAEVNERVLIEASNSAMAGLRALRDTGVQVGLDDFGTGYSSLAYLRQFPLDFVKIDRSFIRDMDRGSSERAIVAAIIGLGHALGLTVVAEGVETSDELDILRELGCDRAQGFLLGEPSGPDAIRRLLARDPDPARWGG